MNFESFEDLLLSYCPDRLSKFLTDNPIFISTISIFIFTFPLVAYSWYLKNKDTLEQLEIANSQFEIANTQQAETLFSNAVRQLLEESSPLVKSVGLKELIRLKHDKSIDSDRIDLITGSGIELKKASLFLANLREANLEGAILEGANLKYADLQQADLREANLREADLKGADLRKVSLWKANLEGATLAGALYNTEAIEGSGDCTIFPKGFDPVGAGMVLNNDRIG